MPAAATAPLRGAVRCWAVLHPQPAPGDGSSEVPVAGGEHRMAGDGCCVNSGIRVFVFNGL